MRSDPNYPRWMFHRTKPMVCVNNHEEESALGREWSRTPLPSTATALPKEDKPAQTPEPEEPVEDEPEPEEEPEKEKPEEEPHPATRPVRPPARKRAAPKVPAKTKTHRR